MTKRARFDETDYAVSSKYRKTRPKIETEKDVQVPIKNVKTTINNKKQQ